MKPINWHIIAHPINWITIMLMLIIAGIAGHYLLALTGNDPSTSGQYSKKQAS